MAGPDPQHSQQSAVIQGPRVQNPESGELQVGKLAVTPCKEKPKLLPGPGVDGVIATGRSGSLQTDAKV